MDKENFSEAVRSHSVNTVGDAKEIIQLRFLYPYSQVVHALAAKVAKDHDHPEKQALLQNAAVYSCDRHVLKEIMMQQPLLVMEQADHGSATLAPIPDSISESKPLSTVQRDEREIDKTLSSVDLADEIMQDLARLYESKHNFEMLFTDDASASFIRKEAELNAGGSNTESAGATKTKREKIKELSKAANGGEAAAPTPVSPKRKKAHASDHIIEEIKTTKQEIEPESERQKEQIELIDHFIKVQPTIPPPKEKNLPPPDLNSIRSGEFGENIISETLVEILVKQGKKDRAIEVLKKLIWKYPQKKAYFASQIEDLKK